MDNFEFILPTKFYFGKDEDKRVGEICKSHGATKIMIIHYGDFVKETGLFGRIADSITNAGISWVEIDGVRPNPRVDLVRKCITQARDEGVDFLLAIGGGSVIDTAKATGVGMNYDGDVWDLYEGTGDASKMTPVGVVLTIPASGSESSDGSVIMNQETHSKRGYGREFMRPAFAVMNPELTYTLPPFQTAAGGFDIMAHVMERYFTKTKHCDVTDELCEGVLRAMVKNIPVVMKEPQNYEARAEIMWAGSMAHSGLLGVGRKEDWGSHELGHALSAFYDINHGATLSIIFPAWMHYVYKLCPQKFAQFAERVWNVEKSEDNEWMALEGIKRMKEFCRGLGLPVRFEDAGIPPDKIEEMAGHCTLNDTVAAGGIKKLYKQDCINIYRGAL
ncbi:iron-containing alcohol dehydrogenase [Luxibacter massiliensis]|uniref:iron-containing alcohol dehydrogenase n=1 Tax=Luxibacter massiliensis TaxID=2219695 RepID=UPI000F05DBD0|nr:iron-containing alcohol dehydrogenase [Luxibacter massiliensis]